MIPTAINIIIVVFLRSSEPQRRRSLTEVMGDVEAGELRRVSAIFGTSYKSCSKEYHTEKYDVGSHFVYCSEWQEKRSHFSHFTTTEP